MMTGEASKGRVFAAPAAPPASGVVDESRMARLQRIVGPEGMAALGRARVMVLGIGGVGSNCIEALARGGVGNLVVVDHDVVQESNINRQAIAYMGTVGRRKIDVAREMIAQINPDANVVAEEAFLTREAMVEFMAPYVSKVDYVVDAIDTVSAKLALAAYAQDAPFKLISCMGAANKLHPECFRFADLYDTVNCPLCRIMRKEGRKRGIRHLAVLYSCEKPIEVKAAQGAQRRERSDLGTMSYVPPIMGQMIAGYVIRDILGLPQQAEG